MTAQLVVERQHTSIEHHETGSGVHSGASTSYGDKRRWHCCALVPMYAACIYVRDSLRKL